MYIIEIIGTFAFALSGISMAALKHFDLFGLYIIGLATAVGGGGVIRDICINEEPLIFRKEIYALACVVGGIIYYILDALHVNALITGFGCMASVIIIRYLSMKYHWQLPEVRLKEGEK